MSRNSCDKSVTDVTQPALQKRDQRREEKSIITAPDDGDWNEARQKASELAKTLGNCSKERDRRLLLGAAFLSQGHANGAKWLEVAARETRAAHPTNPYAFFQRVAYNQAETDGVDLSTSVSRLDIPAEYLQRRKQPC